MQQCSQKETQEDEEAQISQVEEANEVQEESSRKITHIIISCQINYLSL